MKRLFFHRSERDDPWVRMGGSKADAGFYELVARLDAAFEGMKGRQRSADAGPNAAAGQNRRHSRWTPPGFERTLDIVDDMVGFFEAAKTLRHPMSQPEARLPPDLEEAIKKTCQLGHGVAAWRASKWAIFKQISIELRPWSARVLAKQPAHVAWAAGGTHPALIAATSIVMGSPDVEFPRKQCLTGFPVVGRGADTGLWPLMAEHKARKRDAAYLAPRELFKTNSRWVRQLMRSKKAAFEAAVARGDEAYVAEAREAWAASIKERDEKGTARGPYTVDQMDTELGYGKWRPAWRFVIWQGKWRPCDNFRASRTNKAWAAAESMTNARADIVARCGMQFHAEAVERGWIVPSDGDEVTGRVLAASGFSERDLDMGSGGEDEADAYRGTPVDQLQLTVTMQMDPTPGPSFGQVRCFVPRGSNFGLAAAVPNYNRKPEHTCAFARRMFAAVVEHFFDDGTAPEMRFALGPEDPNGVAGLRFPWSSQGILCQLSAEFGWGMAVAKHVAWSQQPVFTGVVTDFSVLIKLGVVRMRCKPSTTEKASGMVKRAEAAQSLAPQAASALKGVSRWVMAYQRAGRAALQPIEARINEPHPPLRADGDGEERWPLTVPLRESLAFVRMMLDGLLPDAELRAAARERPPAVFLSDAMFKPANQRAPAISHVAWIMWYPLRTGGGRLLFSEGELPVEMLAFFEAMRAKKTYICQAEEVGIAAPYFSPEVAQLVRGEDVLHFADNKAANAGAVKGSSSSPDMARIVSALHLRWVELQISPWIEFVKSAANLADLPSRVPDQGVAQATALIRAMGAVRVPFKLPPYRTWDGSS